MEQGRLNSRVVFASAGEEDVRFDLRSLRGRDGVAVVLGLAVAALAMCVTAGVMLMAWVWGREWLLGLL